MARSMARRTLESTRLSEEVPPTRMLAESPRTRRKAAVSSAVVAIPAISLAISQTVSTEASVAWRSVTTTRMTVPVGSTVVTVLPTFSSPEG